MTVQPVMTLRWGRALRSAWAALALCWLLAAGLVLWGNLGGGSFMYFQF